MKSLVPAGDASGSGKPDSLGTYASPLILATGTYLNNIPPTIVTAGGATTALVFTSKGTGNTFGTFAPPTNIIAGLQCLDCEPHPYAATIDNVIANDPGMVMGSFTTVNGATSWHDFMFQSYTPGFGGAGSGPAVPATFDPATQKFSWTTIGSAPGTYRWQVSATNIYGTDSGLIIVRVVGVPEPATLTLISLAFSCAIFRRRR